MWLSELIGRLQQRLHEEGDMRVKTKVRGIHFSDYDKNFVDVESHSFVVVHIKERYNLDGGLIPDATFVEYFKEYEKDLREALAKDFIPQWAERLFNEDYEIKLWF